VQVGKDRRQAQKFPPNCFGGKSLYGEPVLKFRREEFRFRREETSLPTTTRTFVWYATTTTSSTHTIPPPTTLHHPPPIHPLHHPPTLSTIPITFTVQSIITISHHHESEVRFVFIAMATVNLCQNDLSLESMRTSFQNDGFIVFHNVIDPTLVTTLQSRLDEVLRGQYNRNSPPDKAPILQKKNTQKNHVDNGSIVSPLARSDGDGSNYNSQVLQIINIHKCDHDFRQLATSPEIGRMVAELAGWKHGARLAQDQVWAK